MGKEIRDGGSALRRSMVVVWVVLWWALMFLPGIKHGLWRPDEHRVAGICAEMARTGDIVTPRLNGRPFLEKPPLYFAVGAFFGKMIGTDSDVSYRLASMLFATLTLGVTFLMVRRNLGEQGGILAVGILVSTQMFFKTARWIQVDMALVFGVTLAMYAYLLWLEDGRKRHSLLLGLGIAVSFMVKGLVGPALVGVAVLADTIRLRKPKNVWWMKPFLIAGVVALPVIVWTIALYHDGGWSYVREVIVVNNFMRFAGIGKGAALGHQHGIKEYFRAFPGDFMPWTVLFILALVYALRNFRSNRYVCWFIAPFILLCMSSTKRDLYLLPLYPAAACMVADWLQNGEHGTWRKVCLVLTWAFAGAMAIAPIAGIWLEHSVLGFVLGSAGLSSFLLLFCKWSPFVRILPSNLRLVLSVCIAWGCIAVFYFAYRTPHKDYLSFARQAVAVAGSEEITILCPDEILEGVLPMVAGKTFPVVETLDQNLMPGLYAWAGSRDRIQKQLAKTVNLDVLLKTTLDGHKGAVLARIRP